MKHFDTNSIWFPKSETRTTVERERERERERESNLTPLCDTLSESNLNILLAIAQQCPLTGGLAVFMAQSVLRAQAPDIEFNVDSLCALAGYRIEEESENSNHRSSEILIYPNPAREIINIISNEIIEEIRVYSIQGELLYQSFPNSNELNVNTSTFSSGLFFVSIRCNNKVYFEKVQIIK